MYGSSTTIDLIDRTLFNLRTVWRGFRGGTSQNGRLSPELADGEIDDLRRQMHECLESRGGDVSARARAAALGEAYLDLNDTGRRRFLNLLAEDFGVNHEHVVDLATQLSESDDPEQTLNIEGKLRKALRPPRVSLLTQLNSLPSGVRFLVDLRADMRRLRENRETCQLRSRSSNSVLG